MNYSLSEFNINNDSLSKFLQSKILLCVVVLLFTLKIASVAVTVNFPQNIFFADITARALENFANQTRLANGLNTLAENQKLSQAAKMKAENMVKEGYFNHISPTGISPWHWFLQVGYNYKYAGENLAIGFFDSKEVFQAWLNSASHKANILNPNYKEVGTAVLDGFGQNNAIVVVQEFGSQKILPAPIEKQPEKKEEKQVVEVVKQEVVAVQNAQKVLSLQVESQNFENILQDVIYGVSFIIIGVLTLILLLNMNLGGVFTKDLALRAVLLMALLSLAASFDITTISWAIPHQINIQ